MYSIIIEPLVKQITKNIVLNDVVQKNNYVLFEINSCFACSVYMNSIVLS